MDREFFRKYINIVNESSPPPSIVEEIIDIHDSFDIELNEHFIIETGVVGYTDDGIVIEADETILDLLEINDIITESVELEETKPGLWANIHAKRERIKSGSGERMRKPGSKGAPTDKALKQSQTEEVQLDEKCWDDYKQVGMKKKGGKTVPNCVPKEGVGENKDYMDTKPYTPTTKSTPPKMDTKPAEEKPLKGNPKDYIVKEDDLEEAEYQGRKVPLGKPMAGDVKKSKVYVRKPNGKVVKVNFGDKNMKIKKSNPNRRKSFRARHRCENPGPRWKARYWSCRAW